ncbi:unnamed protein product [Absidia cylindrospora]
MDTNNLPPLPGLERISSSCSTSSICTTSTMSSSADTILSDEHLSNLDYLQLSPSESTTTGTTKRRKRQNSVMIIKPARWSPPLCQGQQTQPEHHHHHTDISNAYNEKNGISNTMSSTAIDIDFKPTFYNPNEVKHRRRISTHQCSVLEEEYQTNAKPTAAKRHQLAERLDMTPRTVQIWFQNKRAKAKQHQQQQQQQQQQKNKPVALSTCHHATPQSSISATKSESSSSSLSATMPLDMFTFDDGRLDPVYLIDDHSAATLPSSASSPSLSKCGTMLPSNEDDHEVAAVVAPMTGVYDTSMMGDHGTTQLAPTAAPAAAPAISSPLLPSSETTGTCDAFTMWPHRNDTHHHLQPLPPQDTLPQFSSATTSSSSTPLQQFSSLDLISVLQPYQQQSHDTMDGIEQSKNKITSSMDPSSSPRRYIISTQNDDHHQQHQQQQHQQHCHDCSFDQPFTQKLSTDPGFGTSMVPTWPYMMNQHAIQNDYLDFVLDQDDWMGPFYACA